jgi:NSS family neurotransmitter:Na+ symporter
MSVSDVEVIEGRAPRPATTRGQWSSRTGFILAAAGSAVGLGSIWKFPYITGTNGGGWFVLIYLACIALVAVPIMIAEILLGRMTQRSPVGAFLALSSGTRWSVVGWTSIAAGFLILSYYFVVSGWTLHYTYLAITGRLSGTGDVLGFERTFADLYANPRINVLWQFSFVSLTFAVVAGGVQRGIERCCRTLFPLLLVVMIALLVQAVRSGGFERGVDFVFALHDEQLTARAVLEALGHSFFTLSLGMGAMITYGSYLSRRDDVVAATFAVAGLDTLVSLLSCVAIFPIIFAFALDAAAGPGLVFVALPPAFSQMPGGQVWAVVWFASLAIAALSSTVSVFEVVVSHLVDRHRLSRGRACVLTGIALFAAGVPAALSGGTELFGVHVTSVTAALFGAGRNWFDFVDHVASNWLLPLSGLGIAVFFAWSVGREAREQAFKAGTRFARLYWIWVWMLRYLAPPAVVAVFAHATGLI